MPRFRAVRHATIDTTVLMDERSIRSPRNTNDDHAAILRQTDFRCGAEKRFRLEIRRGLEMVCSALPYPLQQGVGLLSRNPGEFARDGFIC
ncbi:MAG: hypothetical protein ABS76_35595 [Pelagibacterium sp. SCN 64-44]|nr:MAG: hypothetical protein ABS76_35595 [Pelagibacterium sp. SCN 64-44]